MIKFQKARAFYATYDRKEAMQNVTTYCPGCGHGIAHKLIARAIDELGIQDRVIMCSPVGCSVFLYYYFDTGNVECSHGRAPAVATGIKRSIDDAISVCYQGDGDLAGIGTTEIIHAANRGENMTVFFVNNAIYGMTGGQMAPTTLLGQKTLTTPTGRSADVYGGPIGMAELLNALKTPVYIERVSLASPAKIARAQKAVIKALANQVERRGFSFVEILSPCPTNWKIDPVESLAWITEKLEPEFPIKVFRDNSAAAAPLPRFAQTHPWLNDDGLIALLKAGAEDSAAKPVRQIQEQGVKISGFGGQGVMSAGVLLANCAATEGLQATWLPSYGAEMRGGTANASIIISSEKIGSPVVHHPKSLLVMNGPSLDAFEDSVEPGGIVFLNSSIITRKIKRTDIMAMYVPASDIAKKENFLPGATLFLLCVFVLSSKIISIDTVKSLIPISLAKKKQFIDINLKIVQRAELFYEENREKG